VPELSKRELAFCLQYASGEHAGNGTRSYLAAFPKTKYSSAAVAAHEILKNPKVQQFLAALYRDNVLEVGNAIRPWADLVPEAQAVMVATMRGRLRDRLAMEASQLILDRALGKPTQHLEHELVRDEARINKALHALTKRREVADG
jgi:hypothetical protein